MRRLAHDEFFVLGHDRGSLTAFRMAMNYQSGSNADRLGLHSTGAMNGRSKNCLPPNGTCALDRSSAYAHGGLENIMTKFFSSFATKVADLSGKPATFVLAVALVLVWAISGPFFAYSETWQLVINTSTTIITFLMVFVLQNSQNRDGKALQAKLDELILTSTAQNKFVGIEKLDEPQLREMSRVLAEKAECVGEVADGRAAVST